MWWLAAIPAIASLAGGLINYFGGKKTDSENRKAQEQVNQQNYQAQKEFAQNSIQWKVDDAKKAGLHPLAAIGAQSSYYTPSAVAYQSQNNYQHLGNAVSDMGQNIGNYLMQAEANKAVAETAKFNAEAKRIEYDTLLSAMGNYGQSPVKDPAQAGKTAQSLVNQDVSSRVLNDNFDLSNVGQHSLYGLTSAGNGIFHLTYNKEIADVIESQGIIKNTLQFFDRFFDEDPLLNADKLTTSLKRAGAIPKNKKFVPYGWDSVKLVDENAIAYKGWFGRWTYE